MTNAKSTEADRVFDGIVGDILAGALRPRERLSERDLVSRYGVSRTPVREAINRLFERGFVEAGPKGVAVIVEISGEDLRKLYELRLQLEANAATQTAANITEAEIDSLRKINKQFGQALAKRDLVRMLEIRAEFHAVVVAAARNRWLADVLVMLRERAYVVRHSHWMDLERATQTLHIHDEMIEALRNHEGKRYRELVSRQIQAAIESYERQLRPPAPRSAAVTPPPPAAKRSRSAAKA